MEFQKPLCLFLTLISISLSSSHAYKFNVGGQEGWVLNPTESYNHWAERNRFLINDTLYFKYKKGSDSVLLVNEDDYSNCNTKHPFLIMVSGDSEFTFDRSGPFYFISGNPDHCLQGQKLIVVVLHPIIIIPPPAAAPTTTPSPCTGTQQPPQVVPPSTSHAPKGSSPVPATSPPTSPSAYPPKGLSPPAAASSPSSPPSSQSPSANSPSPAAATSPNASSPTATSPTTTPSSGNAPSPPSSTNPNTPADVTPPPSSESQTSGPSKSSAGATTSGLRMLGVSLLLGLVSSAFVGVN